MQDQSKDRPIYTMLYRPVSTFTLPRGVTTAWARLPAGSDQRMRDAFPGIEVSEHPFGDFTTDRDLTDEEMEQFQVKRVDAGFVRRQRMDELDKTIEKLNVELDIFSNNPDDVAELTREIDAAKSEREKLAAEAAA